jgi:hypothetical protein
MITRRIKITRYTRRVALLIGTALILAACGGGGAEPAAPAATTAPTNTPETAPSAPESPLDQPQSPLGQPESPLTAAPAAPTAAPEWPRSEEEAKAVADQTTVPEPLDGFGAIAGEVYSYGIGEAVPGTQFYLTRADEVNGKFVPPEVYFGPRPETGDIVGMTTGLGQVQLNNVPPGHYYMLLWTVYNWLSVYESEGAPAPLQITIEAGDKLDLGMIYVNWP